MKKTNFAFLFKLFLVFILALSLACNRNAQKSASENDSFYTIPFAEIIKNQRQVNLSEFADDVEIIQLENIPVAMLANVEDIEFNKDYIFIQCYHFDQNKPESEREEKGLVVYNKKTNEGVAVEETKQAGFIDDLTGGPDFRPTVTNGNTALMLISALEMKQYLESDAFKNREVNFPAEQEKLFQLNKTLTAEDNHFVILAKLKE